MTLSILTYDPETNVFAAAAATGSYCVGGWVLRGEIETGLVASQGTAPSTFWRDGVMRRMYAGEDAEQAVRAEVEPDSGRDHRQLIALDRTGKSFGFTGAASVPFAAHETSQNLAVAGNMLAGPDVLEAMRRATEIRYDSPANRMLAVLDAATKVGGDARGLQSAALLILSPDHPPLDLRIDCHETPLAALRQLCASVHQPPYYDWLTEVPVLNDKSRALADETTSS